MVLQNPPIIYTHPVLMNRRQCVASLAVQSTWDRTPPHVCSSRTSANRQSTQRRTFHGCYHLVKKLCRTVDFRTITPCSLVGGTNLTKKNILPLSSAFGRRENTVGTEDLGSNPDKATTSGPAVGSTRPPIQWALGFLPEETVAGDAHSPTHLHPMQSLTNERSHYLCSPPLHAFMAPTGTTSPI